MLIFRNRDRAQVQADLRGTADILAECGWTNTPYYLPGTRVQRGGPYDIATAMCLTVFDVYPVLAAKEARLRVPRYRRVAGVMQDHAAHAGHLHVCGWNEALRETGQVVNTIRAIADSVRVRRGTPPPSPTAFHVGDPARRAAMREWMEATGIDTTGLAALPAPGGVTAAAEIEALAGEVVYDPEAR